jgi:hypothetical protein
VANVDDAWAVGDKEPVGDEKAEMLLEVEVRLRVRLD